MKPCMDVYAEKKHVVVCKHYSGFNFPSLSSLSQQLDAFTCFSQMGKLRRKDTGNKSLQMNSSAKNTKHTSYPVFRGSASDFRCSQVSFLRIIRCTRASSSTLGKTDPRVTAGTSAQTLEIVETAKCVILGSHQGKARCFRSQYIILFESILVIYSRNASFCPFFCESVDLSKHLAIFLALYYFKRLRFYVT